MSMSNKKLIQSKHGQNSAQSKKTLFIKDNKTINPDDVNKFSNSFFSPKKNVVTTSSNKTPIIQPNSIPSQNQINPLAQSAQLNKTSRINNSSNIKVVCRFRPLNDKEKTKTKDMCIESISEESVEIKSKNEYNNFTFTFDRMFDVTTTQKEIYDYTAKELIDSVLDGYNATIFAYGQTASGKTYTMQGELDNPEREGITPRMVRHIFRNIMLSNTDTEYTVKLSMIEIYMEKIKDLINQRTNLNIRERDKEIFIEDLSEHYVSTEEDVMSLIKIGSENRTISTTLMNDASSRSHALLILTVHQKNVKTLDAKTGKLYLVDLAGSEKITKTGSSGITLEEAKIINKSLSTLGMVINALTDGKSSHIPYRESKLTRVLTESLGGNAKTCLIITCSPSQYNESETLSTLRFGTRAKKIKNKPKINKEETVPGLKLQIEKLGKILVLQNNRIAQLEKFIIDNGLTVPNPLGEFSSGGEEKKETEVNSYLPSECSTYEMNQNIEEIQNKFSGELTKIQDFSANSKELMEKLDEANIKIQDLQAIIEQKENIQDEFEQKEEEYKNKINELSSTLENFQRNEAVKKNLKVVDKRTMEELVVQLKNYVMNPNNKIKMNKELSNKIFDLLNNTISSNYIQQSISKDTQSKLCSRLKTETTNKIEIICNGKIVDYKEISEEAILNNIENEALLKTINEKNQRIKFLENDIVEYKDKIEIFERELSADERNLARKIYTLQKSLEQCNNLYQQALTQRSVLKIENQIYEKKLKKRNDKICILVKENYGLIEQLKMKDEKLSYYQKNKNIAIPQLVKVLRGSGNKSMLTEEMENNEK